MKHNHLEPAAKGISRPRIYRRRSTSLPRLRDRSSLANRPLSVSHRTGSLVDYLEDLPHYHSVQQGEVMAENVVDPQERLIPRSIQEHNGMPTELWLWDQKFQKIMKRELKATDPIHQPTPHTDMNDMQTKWERYRVPDGQGSLIEAILWNVIDRDGVQTKVLMTMETFRIQRPRFVITRPNYIRLRNPQEHTLETSPEGTPERENTPSDWEERDNEDVPGAQAPLPQQQAAVGAREISLQEEIRLAEEQPEPGDLGPSCSTTRGRRTNSKPKNEDPTCTPDQEEHSADEAENADSGVDERVRLTQVVNERALTRQAAKKATDPNLRAAQEELAASNLKAQLKKVTKELKTANRHIGAMNADFDVVSEENNELRQNMAIMNREMDMVTDQASGLARENENIIAEQLRAQADLTEKDEQFSLLNSQSRAQQKKLAEQASENSRLQEENTSLKRDRSQLQEERMELQNQVGQERAKNDRLQAQIEQEQGRTAASEQARAESDRAQEEQIQLLNQRLEARAGNRSESIDEYLAESNRLTAQLQEAQATISRLRESEERAKATERRLQTDLTFYQTANEGLRSREEGYTRTQADREAELESQRRQISQKTQELSVKDREIAELQRKLEASNQENRDLREKVAHLENQPRNRGEREQQPQNSENDADTQRRHHAPPQYSEQSSYEEDYEPTRNRVRPASRLEEPQFDDYEQDERSPGRRQATHDDVGRHGSLQERGQRSVRPREPSAYSRSNRGPRQSDISGIPGVRTIQPRITYRNQDNDDEERDGYQYDQNGWGQDYQDDDYNRRPASRGRRVTIANHQDEDMGYRRSRRNSFITSEEPSSDEGSYRLPTRNSQQSSRSLPPMNRDNDRPARSQQSAVRELRPTSSQDRHRSTIPGNNRYGSAEGSSARTVSSPQGAAESIQDDASQSASNVPEGPVAILADMLGKSLGSSRNDRPPEKHKIFSGKPQTIDIQTWIRTMEDDFTPEMSEHDRIRYMMRHLDPSEKKLGPRLAQMPKSLEIFKDHLRLMHNATHKPFRLAKWQFARRYNDTKFREWIGSRLAIELIERTAELWGAGDLSDEEMEVVMQNLQRLIPRKVLADFYSTSGTWDLAKLRRKSFLDIIQIIINDEQTWEQIWTEFNNSSQVPEVPRGSTEEYRINSIARAFNPKGRKGKKGPSDKKQYQKSSNQDKSSETSKREDSQKTSERGGYRGRGQSRGQRTYRERYQNSGSRDNSQSERSYQPRDASRSQPPRGRGRPDNRVSYTYNESSATSRDNRTQSSSDQTSRGSGRGKTFRRRGRGSGRSVNVVEQEQEYQNYQQASQQDYFGHRPHYAPQEHGQQAPEPQNQGQGGRSRGVTQGNAQTSHPQSGGVGVISQRYGNRRQ